MREFLHFSGQRSGIRHLIGAPLGLLSAALFLSGCGASNEGPRQYAVSGEVEYDGQPLKLGRVTFVPDSERGNSGPPGYAVVQEGRFDTGSLGGKHSVSGPIKVLITGYGEPDANGNYPEEPIFTDYAIPQEISDNQRKTALTLQVPKVPEKKKRK